MQNLLKDPMMSGMDTPIGAEIKAFLLRAFNAVIDFIYTQISTLFDFLTQPVVLGTLAGLSIIYIGYRWVKSKTSSL